jgi:hypothetical protein
MARYRRKDALEIRLRDDVRGRDTIWTVDLIAKRATGVAGWRMTLAFLEREGPGSAFVELPPAATREEATERAETLRDDPARLVGLLADRLRGD